MGRDGGGLGGMETCWKKNDTCAWTPNKINLELKNADRQAIGSWAEVSLGTLGTQAAMAANLDKVAVGSWS